MNVNLNGDPLNAAQRLMFPLWRAALQFAWRDYRAGHAYRGTVSKRRNPHRGSRRV